MSGANVLYSFRRCPFAMRARMALLVSAQPVEIREVALRDKPAALFAASPKATVPVLVLGNGRVIDESLDIMRWALDRNDPEDWRAGDDARLIALYDDRFKHHLDRYKYADRHAADPVVEREAGLALLHLLELRLTAHANFCRHTRALTDIALLPFVRQFAAVDPAWFEAAPVPRVRHWLASHLATPLFAQAMARLKPWVPDDRPTR